MENKKSKTNNRDIVVLKSGKKIDLSLFAEGGKYGSKIDTKRTYKKNTSKNNTQKSKSIKNSNTKIQNKSQAKQQKKTKLSSKNNKITTQKKFNITWAKILIFITVIAIISASIIIPNCIKSHNERIAREAEEERIYQNQKAQEEEALKKQQAEEAKTCSRNPVLCRKW